jgi:hypothetical protein
MAKTQGGNNAPRPEDPTQKKWLRTAVYGKQGAWPTEKDELIGWRFLGLHVNAGGLVQIRLDRDLGLTNTRLKDRKLAQKSNWKIDVWELDEDGERLRGLCCGEAVEEQFELSSDGEHEVAVATIPTNWTGAVKDGQLVFNRASEQMEIADHDLEFNPLAADGKIVPNRLTHPISGMEKRFSFWLDPESGRTSEAREYVGCDVAEWTLFEAIKTLTKWLNTSETNVRNPVLLESFFSDAPPMKNNRLPRGKYLADYLTALLPSFGYDWFYTFATTAGVEHTRPQIKIFRRGEGARRSLQVDEIGKAISKSTLEQLGFSISVVSVRNRTIVHGELKQFEVTIPLFKGWHSSSDGREETYAEDETSAVGRLWVANEAGDYIGRRPQFETPPDFGPEFIPKRRKIEACLRYQDDTGQEGQRRPAFVEYREAPAETWKPLTASGIGDFRILTNQIGIWFSKQALQLLDPAVELRITGTIPSDERLKGIYDDTATSVNGSEFEIVLDETSQFHYRERMSTGDFASVLDGPSDLADDSGPADDFAERIGQIQRAATVGGTPQLTGFRNDYEIGQLITGIQGRNISFNCLSLESGKEAFPQITSVRFEVVGELRTYPTLMPYTEQDPDARVGRSRRSK